MEKQILELLMSINERIGILEVNMNAKINELEVNMNKKMNELEVRVNKRIDEKIDGLKTSFISIFDSMDKTIEKGFKEINEKIELLSASDALNKKILGNHDLRIINLETKVS